MLGFLFKFDFGMTAEKTARATNTKVHLRKA
jgi:hypothetical protein